MYQANKQKLPKKLLYLILTLIILVVTFFSGFFFAVWKISGQNVNISVSELISSGTSSLFVHTEEINPNLFWQIWDQIEEKYVERPVDEKRMFYGALEGLVDSLDDPYSIFLSPEMTDQFNRELSGSFEGIGAEIGIKNDQLTIIAPLSDSPAQKAGLKAGDKIIEIDGHETFDINLNFAVSLIRGEKGTDVILKIISKDSEEARDVTITRDEINVKSVNWELLDGNIAYIEIIHFNQNTVSNFNKSANEIILVSPDGIILDLRNNPGGYLDSAIDISGNFIEDDVIVIEDFKDRQKEYKSKGEAKLKGYELVVLVNGGSASASEIVAGALQDYDLAVLVGETTFGKGSVQDFQEFSDGSSLKITVANWLTPNGRLIDDVGIKPDIEIELTSEDYNGDSDPQLDKAIEIISQ